MSARKHLAGAVVAVSLAISAAGAAPTAGQAMARPAGPPASGESVPGLGPDLGINLSDAAEAGTIVKMEDTAAGPRIHDIDVSSVSEARAVVAELREDSDVIAAAVPARSYRIQGRPSPAGKSGVTSQRTRVDLTDKLWGLRKINAEQQWPKAKKAVLVAVIDTGVRASHEDLAGRVLEGRTYVSGDGTYTSGAQQDDFGHGTHVAGTIAAHSDNALGIDGVAPNVSILPIRVAGADGAAYDTDIASGILYAVEAGASIVNISMSGYSADPMTRKAAQFAYSQGVLIVAAAGNDGRPSAAPNPPEYPAAFAHVAGVAATDQSDRRASFSTVADHVDVAAPGAGIWSAVATSDFAYERWDGTSMAAPHVSGAVASLMGSRVSAWSALDALKRTARDVEARGKDVLTGAGRIDMARAASTLRRERMGYSAAVSITTKDRPRTASRGQKIQGHLRGDQGGISDAVVRVSVRSKDGRTLVRRARTDATGAWSARFPIWEPVQVRALAEAAQERNVAELSLTKVRPNVSVSVARVPRSLARSHLFVVLDHPRNVRVRLQVLNGSRWRTVLSRQVRAADQLVLVTARSVKVGGASKVRALVEPLAVADAKFTGAERYVARVPPARGPGPR